MEKKRPKFQAQKGKEIYILKIYRRGSDTKNTLVGTIEDLKGEKKGVFNTEMGLLRWILKQKEI